jgi:hypothetical protein
MSKFDITCGATAGNISSAQLGEILSGLIEYFVKNNCGITSLTVKTIEMPDKTELISNSDKHEPRESVPPVIPVVSKESEEIHYNMPSVQDTIQVTETQKSVTPKTFEPLQPVNPTISELRSTEPDNETIESVLGIRNRVTKFLRK